MSAPIVLHEKNTRGSDTLTIAVLGTGRMGEPIAHNLLSAGFPVRVWNRTAAKTRRLSAAGAQALCSPATAAVNADILVTMLADGPATEQAMAGPDGALGALAPGAIWVQMGTVGLEWTQNLSALAHEHGVSFVDAPVSGSDGPARDGQLVILASGDESLEGRLQPMFAAIGRRTLWLGSIGNGSALKLALNAWLAAITETAAETVTLSETLGLDPRLLIETLSDLPLGAPYALAKASAMIERQYEPGFALGLAHKDVELAVSAANRRGLTLPIIEQVNARWDAAIADGHGDQDVAVVVEPLRLNWSDASRRPAVDKNAVGEERPGGPATFRSDTTPV
jgi:3-hydroxyisobutyrate dehydrogenase